MQNIYWLGKEAVQSSMGFSFAQDSILKLHSSCLLFEFLLLEDQQDFFFSNVAYRTSYDDTF